VRRKNVVLVCLLGLALLALSSGAKADTIQFLGATGPVVGGVYVAPYQLSINGGAPINAICDDFADHVTSGEIWTATITSFPLNGLFTGGLFGSHPQLYDEAIWLYSQFLFNGAPAGGINYAIWALFNSSVTGTSGFASSGAAAWVTSANNWYNGGGVSSFNFSGYQIITPTSWSSSLGRPQEYISYSTPEPGSLLLFGSGLIGIGGFIRRKLRA
jgi:hypothetical protein